LHLHGEPAPLACSLSHGGGIAMAIVLGMASHPVASPTSHPTGD
jgi:hypothetical protein